MKKVSIIAGASLLFPLVSFAAAANFTYITSALTSVTAIINLLTPIIFAIAILYFFWGLAKFIMSAGDEEARASGKQIMIWGIVGLFVMVSVYGLIQILQNIVGANANATINVPLIKTTAGR